MKLGLALGTAVWLLANLTRAAELPSRSAKTAADPKTETCEIEGHPGIRLPGGQTCLHIGGYVSAQTAIGGH